MRRVVASAACAAALLACLGSAAAQARETPLAATEAMLAEELLTRWGDRIGRDGELSIQLARPPLGDVSSIQQIAFDPASGRFAAIVVAGTSLQRVSGTARSEIEIPVPLRRILPGETIMPEDLSTVRVPATQARNAAVDIETLVGKAARRVLAEGRPVNESSVGEPLVVQRSQPVSLVYTVGGLRITAKGRALADGSVGDTIRAVNEESHRTVTGTVLGEGAVGVTP